jgi:hypothetical protein
MQCFATMLSRRSPVGHETGEETTMEVYRLSRYQGTACAVTFLPSEKVKKLLSVTLRSGEWFP